MGADQSALTNHELLRTALEDFKALSYKPNDLFDPAWLSTAYQQAISDGVLTRNDQWLLRKRTNLANKKRNAELVLHLTVRLQPVTFSGPPQTHLPLPSCVQHHDEFRRKQLKFLQRESWFWVANLDSYALLLQARCQLLARYAAAYQRTLRRAEVRIHSLIRPFYRSLILLWLCACITRRWKVARQ
jgi:hypothetical protein